MGQYHAIYNLDKKEYISFCGAKLWEKAYSPLHSMALNVLLCNSNGRGGGDLCNPIQKGIFEDEGKFTRWSNEKQKKIRCSKADYETLEAAINSISGKWAGDRILIQGDYAEKTDPAFQTKTKLKGFKDITESVLLAFTVYLDACSGDESAELAKQVEFEKRIRAAK